MWWLARPLVAWRVPPDVVTVAGLACSAAAVAAPPGRGAAWLVAGAVADGLDGAVAVLTDSSSAHGRALDHTADRVADVAAAAVLLRAGAPSALVLPGLAMSFGLEFARGRRPPVVTVGERPSRVACGALGDLAARATGQRWPAVAAAVVWDVLAAVALVQVSSVGRRTRRGQSAADASGTRRSSTEARRSGWSRHRLSGREK